MRNNKHSKQTPKRSAFCSVLAPIKVCLTLPPSLWLLRFLSSGVYTQVSAQHPRPDRKQEEERRDKKKKEEESTSPPGGGTIHNGERFYVSGCDRHSQMSGGHRDPAAGSWSSWPRSGGTRGEDDGGCRSSSGAYKKSNALRAPLNIPKVPRKLGRRPPLKVRAVYIPVAW